MVAATSIVQVDRGALPAVAVAAGLADLVAAEISPPARWRIERRAKRSDAWFALMIPVAPRWRTQHEADRERMLRMEFRSFVQRFIFVPAQIVRTGRQLVVASSR